MSPEPARGACGGVDAASGLAADEVAPCLSTGEGGGAERVSMVSNGRVSIAFAPRCRFLLVAAVLVCGSGCDAISGVGCNVTNSAAPEIAKPLGYETVDVPLPGCATPLHPFAPMAGVVLPKSAKASIPRTFVTCLGR